MTKSKNLIRMEDVEKIEQTLKENEDTLQFEMNECDECKILRMSQKSDCCDSHRTDSLIISGGLHTIKKIKALAKKGSDQK